MSKNVAVLVGNGLSVAFNRELDLRSITKEVLKRISELEGDDVVRAMKELAERALQKDSNPDKDFEILVGAFGAESRTLGILNSLAELREPEDESLRKSIKEAASFAEQVRDTGVSHVLQVIAERSRARKHRAANLNALVESIISSFDGKVVFANLNYDTLLLSALMNTYNKGFADMGNGLEQLDVNLGGRRTYTAQQLRKSTSDFPKDKRVQLLHLHGSLTYWTLPTRSVQVKLKREHVTGPYVWSASRKKSPKLRPAVVLASRRDKAEHVTQPPFALAYEMFEIGLEDAYQWLIIGYSFRDEPVNERLREEFLNRKRKPRVLVVTSGEDPKRRTVERAFGWGAEDSDSEGWLTIIRSGADGAEKTTEWKRFIRRRRRDKS